MIVIDTSALIEITAGQPQGQRCVAVLTAAPRTAMAAATLTETLIVAKGRGLMPRIGDLIDWLTPEIIPVDEPRARAAAAAYARWGKGFAPAALNFGDCFAYALAQELNAPLLFVGNDFAQTDVTPALMPIQRS